MKKRYFVNIDSSNRVRIAKKIRRNLCLKPGDQLEVIQKGDIIILKPCFNYKKLEKDVSVHIENMFGHGVVVDDC